MAELLNALVFALSAASLVVAERRIHHVMGERYDCTSNAPKEECSNRKIVCYYTNWSQYRPGDAKFVPENIDVSLCTHIAYAFAKISSGLLAPYEWNDESTEWRIGMYERFNNLKKKKPSLKTLLSVGGWNHGSGPFTEMVRTAESRHRFIVQAISYLRKWKFDGLDIDWEYPGARGSPPEDKDRFTALMQELRQAFQNESVTTGNTQLLLSAAVPAGKDNIDGGYDIPRLVKFVDWFNLMAFDLHGSWENVTGMNSPLYGRTHNDTLSQDWAVHYWLDKGAPRDKLVLGLASYGRSFTLVQPDKHWVGAPVSGPGQLGEFTRTNGFLAYFEIMNRIIGQGWKQVFDSVQKCFYAYKDNQWVGFDNTHSIKLKVKYIVEKDLAGAMLWSLDLDDFNKIVESDDAYPLLKQINRFIAG